MYNAQETRELIIYLLKKNKKKTNQMLKELGFNSSLIVDMNRRKSMPSADKLGKIADYLNVSVDYLLGRTNCPDVLISDENNNIHVIVPTKSKLQKVEESAVNYFDTSTEESKKCLKKFNKLSPKFQEFVIEQMNNLLRMQGNDIIMNQNIAEKHEEYEEKAL